MKIDAVIEKDIPTLQISHEAAAIVDILITLNNTLDEIREILSDHSVTIELNNGHKTYFIKPQDIDTMTRIEMEQYTVIELRNGRLFHVEETPEQIKKLIEEA